MIAEEVKVKAVVNGFRIECGVCRALLAKLDENKPWELGKDKYITFEIKCKAKRNSVKCNAINEVSL